MHFMLLFTVMLTAFGGMVLIMNCTHCELSSLNEWIVFVYFTSDERHTTMSIIMIMMIMMIIIVNLGTKRVCTSCLYQEQQKGMYKCPFFAHECNS